MLEQAARIADETLSTWARDTLCAQARSAIVAVTGRDPTPNPLRPKLLPPKRGA
jgi:hypothetical protein